MSSVLFPLCPSVSLFLSIFIAYHSKTLINTYCGLAVTAQQIRDVVGLFLSSVSLSLSLFFIASFIYTCVCISFSFFSVNVSLLSVLLLLFFFLPLPFFESLHLTLFLSSLISHSICSFLFFYLAFLNFLLSFVFSLCLCLHLCGDMSVSLCYSQTLFMECAFVHKVGGCKGLLNFCSSPKSVGGH